MTHIPSSAGPVYDQRCTLEERLLLDDIARQSNDAAPTDVQAFLDLCEAVVDAAVAETVAEQNAVRHTTSALDAPSRSPALTTADDAARVTTAARAARRDAVQRLLQHRQDGER